MKSNSFDDETLVAYLDGELPGEQAQLVEQEISTNIKIRQRVDSLRATWELLLDLPTDPTPTRDLAQSTIELITLELEKKNSSWWSKLRKNRWLMLGSLAILLLSIGIAAGKIVSQLSNQRFMRSLPVVVELTSLRNVYSLDTTLAGSSATDIEWNSQEDIEWIAKLREIKNLGNFDPPGKQRQIGKSFVPLNLSERRGWCDDLNEQERALLLSNFQDFEKLPRGHQANLIQLADVVYAEAEQSEDTLNAIRAYSALLEEESSRKKREIKTMLPLEMRAAEVQRMVNLRMGQRYAETMPNQDRAVIEKWVDDQMYYLNDIVELYRELTLDSEVSVIKTWDLEPLIDQLSPEARDLYHDIEEKEARSTVFYWIYFVIDPNMIGHVPPDKLRSEFERLSDQHDLLELLPEQDALNFLKRGLLGPEALDESAGADN